MKKLLRFIAIGSVFTALGPFLVVPAKADSEVYDIRQARTGLASSDAIAAIVDTLEGEYSSELETEVVNCIRDAFSKSGLRSVRIVSAEEFRGVAFPNLAPEQVLDQPWDQRLNDPVFRERIAPLGLRYLVAVTVSEGRSLTEVKRPSLWEYAKWQRFAVIAARVVAIAHPSVAGKVTAAVRKTSSAAIFPIPFINPSFVAGHACEEFGSALAKFLASEEQPPQIVMSSLTLKNLFPQRQDKTVTVNPMLARDSEIPRSLLLGQEEKVQVVEKKGTDLPEKPETVETHKVAAASRWEEVRPLIKGRKESVITEDENARWPTRGAGFENAFCHEMKLSLNVLTLNTQALPPLPSRWHLAPVWLAKLASLPMQLAIPLVPILAAPISPSAAAWGLETLYNCLPQPRDDQRKDQPPNTINGDDPGIKLNTTMMPYSTIRKSSISTSDKSRTIDIHDAAATGDVEKVRLLIQENEDLISTRNKAHQTALHIAASNGQTAVVELLLANKANINSRDWQGATPAQLAASRGHSDIVRLLRNHDVKDEWVPVLPVQKVSLQQ